jgi:iron complex transport system substrate-binding protein
VRRKLSGLSGPAAVLPLLAFHLVALWVGLSPGPRQAPSVPEGARPVTDMAGRVVDIGAPAGRVFILTPVLWHYLTVNPDDRAVVKIPPYMRREIGQSVLGRMFPSLAAKETAYTNFGNPGPISVEEVLQAEPDAALVWDYMSQGLEMAGFQRLVKITGDGGDKARLFSTLAQLTNQDGRVGRIWERFGRERAEVAADLGPCAEPARAVVIGSAGFNLWSGPSQRHFTSNLGLICVENAAAGQPSQNGSLNLESLMMIDPDVIYLNPYLLDQTEMPVAAIYGDPRLAGLAAVKNRRVYHMPVGASRLEGPVEVPLSMLWLRLTAHPEKPSRLDMRGKIRRAYSEVYGYRMTEDEIDAWLRLEENSASAGYGRFARDEGGPL